MVFKANWCVGLKKPCSNHHDSVCIFKALSLFSYDMFCSRERAYVVTCIIFSHLKAWYKHVRINPFSFYSSSSKKSLCENVPYQNKKVRIIAPWRTTWMIVFPWIRNCVLNTLWSIYKHMKFSIIISYVRRTQ